MFVQCVVMLGRGRHQEVYPMANWNFVYRKVQRFCRNRQKSAYTAYKICSSRYLYICLIIQTEPYRNTSRARRRGSPPRCKCSIKMRLTSSNKLIKFPIKSVKTIQKINQHQDFVRKIKTQLIFRQIEKKKGFRLKEDL